MPKKTFIDVHCHMFNFVDIPVFETLEGLVNMSTAKKLLGSVALSAFVVAGKPKKTARKYKDFIQFFEREQTENILWMARQVAEAAPGDTSTIVMTPLAMDFDCVKQACGERCTTCTGRICPLYSGEADTQPHDPSAKRQYERLRSAIDGLGGNSLTVQNKNVKVFPFLGLDLRKLTPDNTIAFAGVRNHWQTVGVEKADRKKGFLEIENGRALGIKLYPPIGFSPYPDEDVALKKYLEFYDWCIEEQIPLTVHCQPGSYSVDRDQDNVDEDAHGENWLKLFQHWESGKFKVNGDIRELRINFAHFSGEKCLRKLVKSGRTRKNSDYRWARALVQMLKTYPCAYADISAYDWSSRKEYKENFSRLIEMDVQGAFGDGYPLIEKLMWGSDVPMVLDEDNHCKKGNAGGRYTYILKEFISAVDSVGGVSGTKKQQAVEKITGLTAEKFLLG
jgi:hypothetical protein